MRTWLRRTGTATREDGWQEFLPTTDVDNNLDTNQIKFISAMLDEGEKIDPIIGKKNVTKKKKSSKAFLPTLTF